MIDQKTTGTPADGLGVAIIMRAENSNNDLENAVHIEGVLTDVSNGSEDSAFMHLIVSVQRL